MKAVQAAHESMSFLYRFLTIYERINKFCKFHQD